MLNWDKIIEISRTGNPPPTQKVRKTEAEWQQQLSPQEYYIARQKGTERSFSDPGCRIFSPGLYRCVCCGELLFDATEKFDSGTGWPSFTQPIADNAIAYHADRSHGMVRIEVTCNTCDAHLGHVFPDGPPPHGLRYCINGAILQKVSGTEPEDYRETAGKPAAAPLERSGEAAEFSSGQLRLATFGGGCFWCTEAVFQKIRGVREVVSGYSGGDTTAPTYYQVCNGSTGHAEVVQISYDPQLVSFADLVLLHLCTHDPTTLNRQGADQGTQYRSVVFYRTADEEQMARHLIAEAELALGKHVVTELARFEQFYPAEPEHQNYYRRNHQQRYCQLVIEPKLAHLQEHFSQYLSQ
jgi:peptide methionine sulfoxide reductase msrA/msrB